MPKSQDIALTDWLWPGQVADAFGVSTDTVTRWADSGLLPVYVLPSGHRRYKRSEIEQLLTRDGKASA